MRKLTGIIILSLGLLISSCQTAQENPNAAKGVGIGAVGGALLGGLIGQQQGNAEKGAAIGALLGAGAGGAIGNRLDKQKKELDKIAETKRTDQGLITKLKSDILFDSGKSDLKPAAKENINALAAVIKKYPENILKIKGYTDDTGSAKINGPLSEKRAQAVRDQIVSAGVPSATATSLGMGSENQIDVSKTKAGRSKNRRVEIEITVDASKVPKS